MSEFVLNSLLNSIIKFFDFVLTYFIIYDNLKNSHIKFSVTKTFEYFLIISSAFQFSI